MSAAALGSAIATKQIPQLILSAGNTGWPGYLANAGVGIAATVAASHFLGSKAASGAFVGALVILLDRIVMDQFSMASPYLSLAGVGTVRDGYYFHPVLVDERGTMITPRPVLSAEAALGLAQALIENHQEREGAGVEAVMEAYPQLAAMRTN